MIDVCLLGTGGMMPLPGRHLTALLLRHEGHSILVDCGEGTQVAIRKYAWSMHSIDTICFTHVHGDHVAGISGLLSSMGTEGRTEPVHILGPRHIESIVAQLCVVVGVPFEVHFHEIEHGQSYHSNDIEITPFPVKHNIQCYGYRFDLARRPKFHPERARALEIPVQHWKTLQQGKSIWLGMRRITPDMVLGAPRKGLSLCYATDTRPCAKLRHAATDVDLLITEGIYGDPEKHASAVEKRHMTSQEAAELAKEACAKEVWLTHYSPSFRDQERYQKTIHQINPRVCFAKDGQTTTLLFDED